MDLPRGRKAPTSMNAYYNAEYAKRGLWVRIEVLEEVGVADTAVMDLTTVGEVDHDREADKGQGNAQGQGLGLASGQGLGLTNGAMQDGSGGSGLTGDFFDRPFVPRMMESGTLTHPNNYNHTHNCTL